MTGVGRVVATVALVGVTVCLLAGVAPASQSSFSVTDGFESGDLSGWPTVSGLGVSLTHRYAGSFGGYGDTFGDAAFARKEITPAAADVFARVYFKLLRRSGVAVAILRFVSSSGDVVLSAVVRTDGLLSYNVRGAGVVTNTTVSNGRWHELELHGRVAGSAGAAEIWFDGKRLAGGTADLGTTLFGQVQLGDEVAGRSYEVAYDRVAISDTFFPVAVPTGGAPPDTQISSGPSGTVSGRSAILGFSSAAGATFECKLDQQGFAPCASPVTYFALADGAHKFQVRATNSGNSTDVTPASRTWTVAGPKINSFDPTVGKAGTSVTIYGRGLGSVFSVLFNGVEATIQSEAAGQVKALVPTGATTGRIQVATSDGAAISPTAFTVKAGPGALDPTFAPLPGRVLTPVGSGIAYASAIAVQPDGRLLAAGTSSGGGSDELVLSRYHPNGEPDSSFGIVETPVGDGAGAGALALGPDGSIFVLAHRLNGAQTEILLLHYDGNGRLDTSFGSNGIVNTGFTGFGADLAVQQDGKAVVASTARDDAAGANEFALARYSANGALDTSFGRSGIVRTLRLRAGEALDSRISAVALQPDGKIVAAGWTDSRTDPEISDDDQLVRYRRDGTLDPTFGERGIVVANIRANDYISDLAVQPDGKLVVAGSSIFDDHASFDVIRFLSAGALDTSFGDDGVASASSGEGDTAGDSPSALAVQPDGKIVAAGYTGTGFNFMLARFTPVGAPDTDFGNGGVVVTPIGAHADGARALALQPDGKLIAAGWSDADDTGNRSSFALARYLPNGALDPAFTSAGLPGTVRTHLRDFEVSSDRVFTRGLAIQKDGKLILAGSAGGVGFAVARYASDGSLDPTFDGDGVATAASGSGSCGAGSVAVDGDGRIIVGGSCGLNGDFTLTRLNEDGSIDTTFGTNGTVETPGGGGYGGAAALAALADGRLVAAGDGGNQFMVVRYRHDGTLDTTFGDGDGIVTTPIGASAAPSALVVQPADAKLVVAGWSASTEDSAHRFTIARYQPRGALDTTFGGGDGIVTTAIGGAATSSDAFAVALQPADGKIVAVGDTEANPDSDFSRDFAVARYTKSGTLDINFGGGDGIVTTPVNPFTYPDLGLVGDDIATGVALQKDGKIVVGGTSFLYEEAQGVVARYKSGGALDTTFGRGGISLLHPIYRTPFRSLALQADGKIVAGGEAMDASGIDTGSDENEFLLARFLP